MIDFDEFRDGVRRLKRERWADILAAEQSGHVAGRRPRDPEQEALLAELDRARIARSALLLHARRIPARDEASGGAAGGCEPA
jgi:hypothetical protein